MPTASAPHEFPNVRQMTELFLARLPFSVSAVLCCRHRPRRATSSPAVLRRRAGLASVAGRALATWQCSASALDWLPFSPSRLSLSLCQHAGAASPIWLGVDAARYASFYCSGHGWTIPLCSDFFATVSSSPCSTLRDHRLVVPAAVSIPRSALWHRDFALRLLSSPRQD